MTQVLFATVILAALGKLDPTNDQHWTAGGLPRLDVVKELAQDASLIRDQLTVVAPEFTRANPVLPTVEPQGEIEPARQDDPPVITEETVTTESKDEAGGEPELQVAQPEQPTLENGPEEPQDEIQALEAELEEMGLLVKAASNAYDEAKRHYLALAAKQDALIEKRNAASLPNENGHLIRAYLTAQENRRAQGVKAPIDMRAPKR